jgi:hypothetical protein
MKSCPYCGVRLEEDYRRCPLCNTLLEAGEESDREPEVRHEQGHVEERPRLWLVEVVSLLAAVVAIVVFASDFAFGFRLTWSRIPIASVAYAWICAVAIIALGRRAVLLGVVLTAATLGVLCAIDLFHAGLEWFAGLGAPVVVLGAILAAGVVWIGRSRALSALANIALSVATGGVYAVGIEVIVSRFAAGPITVSWSVVVLACAVSLSLVILLIHRRLRRRHASLERIFHL